MGGILPHEPFLNQGQSPYPASLITKPAPPKDNFVGACPYRHRGAATVGRDPNEKAGASRAGQLPLLGSNQDSPDPERRN